jgi:hypothetical protein
MRGRGGIPAMHYKANEYTTFKISTSIHQSTKQLQNMSPSILITGASGYLGGTLLSHLSHTPLPPQSTLYALVRSDSQASRVQAYGCTPLFLDFDDEAAVVKAIADANISIIFFLIDALHSGLQIPLIKALGEVRRKNGGNVHFLHTSGAKIFSGHAGMPVDRDVNDTDEGLYEMQKEANAPHEIMKTVRRSLSSCFRHGVEIDADQLPGRSNKHHHHRHLRIVWCEELHIHTLHRVRQGRRIRESHLDSDCGCRSSSEGAWSGV